jgi:hypothetical protein
LPSGEGSEKESFTLLDRLRRPLCALSFRKPLASLVIFIVLLSSFSFLVAFALTEMRSDEGGDLVARAETVYIDGTFVVSPSKAYVGTTIFYNVSAHSTVVGATLNFTIYYDWLFANGSINPSSPVTVDTTPNPGTINKTYVYNAPGNYTYNLIDNHYAVRLVINDGMGGWRNVTRYVEITVNEAPEFYPPPTSVTDWDIGVPLNMSVICYDEDNDNLTLTWDFGDGTDLAENVTGPAMSGVYCNQTHTWNPSAEDLYGISDYREYYVKLSLTDGQGHWTNATMEIRLRVGHNLSPNGVLTTNATTIDPGDEVWLLGRASDPEGEPLTWTFVFNNSEGTFLVRVFHTGLTEPNATVWVNTSYVFSDPGEYYVYLSLCDIVDPELQNDPDRSGHNVTLEHVKISSIENRIPFAGKIYVEDFLTGSQDVVLNDTVGVAIAVFTVQVRDEDGEVLSATWDFGDDSDPAHNLSAGGTGIFDFVQIHEYSTWGQYNVSVLVTDGREGHDVLRYKLVNISAINAAPEVRGLVLLLDNGSFGSPGTVVEIILTLYDREQDPLTVSWDLGDGSPVQWTNVSSFSENGTAICRIEHIYDEVGDYTVRINYTDGIVGLRGLHKGLWEVYVPIKYPHIIVVRYWDWWDYGSLSLFILSLALLVLWAVMGSIKRSRLDMMGTTMEEYLLRKQEIESYEKRHKGEGGNEEGSG